jgi:adenylate cyclase
MRCRNILAGLVASILSVVILSTPTTDRLDGLSLDSLNWLRQTLLKHTVKPAESPSVVVAIDEETFRRPPFQGLPKVMWTKQLAKVLAGVSNSGATVIGMDLILPTSVERHFKGFDREMLITMRKISDKNQLVLGKVQHQAKPIAPHPGQSFAVHHQKNIRAVNLIPDSDGIIRHVPLTVQAQNVGGGSRREPVLSVELAARSLDMPATLSKSGALKIGENVIFGTTKNRLTLNFDAGSQAIPTYSFADISSCIENNKLEFLQKNFKGKIVLIGTALDEEDRRLTSKRFITGPENFTHGTRCHHPIVKDVYRPDLIRDSIPGVYIHATAVNNIIRDNALKETSTSINGLIAFVISLGIAFLALTFAPIQAGVLAICLCFLWIGLAIFAFNTGYAANLFNPIFAGTLTFVLLLGYKFTISDKDKRYIRKVFSYYLSPSIIEKMTSSEALPTLGGEAKEVTILFSDIVSFSSFCENLSATEVATFLNDYLTEMSVILESHGAFVEKFVADEITAVFGAPMDDSNHALHAVQAALACQERLRKMQGAFGLPQGKKVTARTGINTGEMLVGNIGSHNRFTYAAMGDAANLGSRLEGANKFYGSFIMVGERTAELSGKSIYFRELDSILVVGRDNPVNVFEPLGNFDNTDSKQIFLKENYEKALLLYREGNFSQANEIFKKLKESDPVSNTLSERCLKYLTSPPDFWPNNWNAHFPLGGK